MVFFLVYGLSLINSHGLQPALKYLPRAKAQSL